MDRLSQRLAISRQALGTLSEILAMTPSPVVRDAAIQRFEYTFEALWKAAQLFQKQREGVEAGSPKSVIRACFQGGILEESQARTAMEMAEDRNLTVHTYNEQLAEAIYARLPGYAELMDRWLSAMERRMTEQHQN